MQPRRATESISHSRENPRRPAVAPEEESPDGKAPLPSADLYPDRNAIICRAACTTHAPGGDSELEQWSVAGATSVLGTDGRWICLNLTNICN